MTTVPTKETGDTVTADEWDTIPTDMAAVEARVTALEGATTTYVELTDGETADAGDRIITAISESHTENGTPAETLRTLVSEIIDACTDAEINTILTRFTEQVAADRNTFVIGLLADHVAADEIVALDSSGDLVGIAQDVVNGATLADLLGNYTAASASGPTSLIFDEDTDNGAHAVTLKAPASLAASVDIVLPSTAGTLALSGSALAEWTPADSTTPSILAFFEDTDNGTNRIDVKAPASVASNVVLTLPASTGTLTTGEEVAASYQPLNTNLSDIQSYWTPGSASTAASLDFREDTDNGTNRVRLIGPASTADVSVTLPNKAGTLLTTAGAETLTAGYNVTATDAGTKSSGTYTPDPQVNNFQYAVNGGAHTLAPPATDCCMVVQYTNNGSAGAITTSGFTMVTGDTLNTTNGNDFFCHITRCNGFSHLHVTALQ